MVLTVWISYFELKNINKKSNKILKARLRYNSTCLLTDPCTIFKGNQTSVSKRGWSWDCNDTRPFSSFTNLSLKAQLQPWWVLPSIFHFSPLCHDSHLSNLIVYDCFPGIRLILFSHSVTISIFHVLLMIVS
jgi:hypothetical protein